MTCAEIAVSILGPETDVSDFENRSFVQLGGDSIHAMRLAALVRERLGLQVTLASLLSELPLAQVLKSATPVKEGQQTSGLWDRRAESWRRHLADMPTLLELPSDQPRSRTHDTSGTRIPVDLGQAVTQAVAERAHWLGITQFAFLLGAFGLTLSRWTSARRLLVGVPLIGPDAPDLRNVIAGGGNLVPVRIAIDGDMTAADFLRSVHSSLSFSIDAGDLPFEELVCRLAVERHVGSHPLVQVSVGMYEQRRIEEARGEEEYGGGCQFDLALMFGRADPSLAGYMEFSSGLWSTTDAEGFIADFCAATTELTIVTDPAATRTLEEVRCVSPARRRLLGVINETEREFPASSLDELFREAASRWPTAMAVRDEAAELTYAQLARAVGRQSRLLHAAGVRPGDTVLVGLERSAAEVVAVLGTVSAGAAYVGVDLRQPDAHIAKIVAKVKPTAALVALAQAKRMMSHGVPVVETWNPGWAQGDGDIPLPPTSPGRLAYVAFTSGSTGQPKGVAVPHGAVIRLVHQAGFLRLGPGERVLRLSPLAFDASTLELWGALLNGAVLEICEPGILSPSELGAFLVDREVTYAWLTSGLFRLVVDFAPDSLAGLRHLLTGGDVVPHEHVARALTRNPDLVITNGYGPTENTTFTTVYSVTRPEDVDGPLPIGTPVPGTRVYVLDERGRQVPPGAVGELYAGGEGLADGYFGDEAETARFFGYFCPEIPERLYRTGDMVRIDSRGRLRFLGRVDDQVKVRGYRIELTAIGAALTACPGVQDAIVTVTEGDSAERRIMAAVILAPGATASPADLRDSLAGNLPHYMVPALWAVVDRMPLTANGKIDRRALAALAAPAGKSARTAASPRRKS